MVYQLTQGDSLQILQTLAENSVDAIISDPPYGYGFMNKDWAVDVPSIEMCRQFYRVHKTGGFALLMCAPRQDVSSKFILNLKEAGFDIAFDPIEWVYASGFPKAENLSKAIDRKLLREWVQQTYPQELNAFQDKVDEKGEKISKLIQQNKYISSKKKEWAKVKYNIDFTPQMYAHPAREDRTYVTDSNIFSGDRKDDKIGRKSPFAADHDGEWDDAQITNLFSIDPPISPEAHKLLGQFTASFKPARELILVVQKPIKSSILDHAVQNGNGGLMLDHARIPAEWQDQLNKRTEANLEKYGTPNAPSGSEIYGWNKEKAIKKMVGGRLSNPITFGQIEQTGFKIRVPITRGTHFKDENLQSSKKSGLSSEDYPAFTDVGLRGRFPANLLVSENVLDIGEKTHETHKKPHINKAESLSRIGSKGKGFNSCEITGCFTNPDLDGCDFSDKFSLDRWWNARVKALPLYLQNIFPFLMVPKPSKNEKNFGVKHNKPKKVGEAVLQYKNGEKRSDPEVHNFHPTVKSLALFCYLTALIPRAVERPVILEPYMGSGTGVIASILCNCDAIGNELDEDYFAIASERIAAWQALKNKFPTLDFTRIMEKVKNIQKTERKQEQNQKVHHSLQEFF